MNTPQAHNIPRPQHSTSFVAVETTASKRPVEVTINGAQVSTHVHPEVSIQAYPSALIKSIDDDGTNARITFDASSITTRNGGTLSHDITVNAASEGVCARFAHHAKENNIPCFFGFEVRRKARNSETGEYVPYTTPIHTLMGYTEQRKKSTMDATRANCSKVLAAIGPAEKANQTYISEEARCVPTEWEAFSTNHDGTITPAGWVRPTVDDAPAGCLVPADEAPAPVVGEAIANELKELKAKVDDLLRSPSYSSARGEAKPWMIRNHDGSINPGSYAVHAVTVLQQKARIYVNGEKNIPAQRRGEAVSHLAKALVWMVDQTQKTTVGYVDRIAASYKTASEYVAMIIECELRFYSKYCEKPESGRKWAREVVKRASAAFTEALELTISWDSPTPPADDDEAQGDESGETPSPAPNSQQVADNGGGQTAADVPELAQRWNALIDKINMAEHFEHLNPILTATFGSFLFSQINAEDFATKISAWEADTDGFIEAAKAAYRTAGTQAA